jgi:hypothetical protein
VALPPEKPGTPYPPRTTPIDADRFRGAVVVKSGLAGVV